MTVRGGGATTQALNPTPTAAATAAFHNTRPEALKRSDLMNLKTSTPIVNQRRRHPSVDSKGRAEFDFWSAGHIVLADPAPWSGLRA
jgi:hypothetical protein